MRAVPVLDLTAIVQLLLEVLAQGLVGCTAVGLEIDLEDAISQRLLAGLAELALHFSAFGVSGVDGDGGADYCGDGRSQRTEQGEQLRHCLSVAVPAARQC